MANSRRIATGALAVVALAAVGCGSDDGTAPSTNGEPTVSRPGVTATAPTITATVPATTETAPATPPGTVESQPGGAGDEEAAVAPATFTINGNAIDPPDVSVPAFFTIRVTGKSGDGKPHTIAFEGKSASVAAGGKASFDVEGLKAGVYPVTVDGRAGAVTITTGGEPGP